MEVVDSSETSVNFYEAKQRHIPHERALKTLQIIQHNSYVYHSILSSGKLTLTVRKNLGFIHRRNCVEGRNDA
jgi:hypothetical protein